MARISRIAVLCLWAGLGIGVHGASAQVPLAVGTRAQGMGGAFTAVADDASATWWNPAGLASGAYASVLLERVRVEPREAVENLFQSRTTAFAVAFPALGISYYRFRAEDAGALPSIVDESGDRQKNTGEPGVRALAISQYGITTGQSITHDFVVATTLKVLRAGKLRQGGTGGLAEAEALEVGVATRFDVDLGLMAAAGPLRIGATIRNLTTPEFGAGGGDLELDRQVRLGVALVGERLRWPVTLAVDADMTETRISAGDVRHAAVGIETWAWSRRVGLRGGVSVNTTGDRRTAASGGMSVRLPSGLYLQGAITRGADITREGWSLGLSVAY